MQHTASASRRFRPAARHESAPALDVRHPAEAIPSSPNRSIKLSKAIARAAKYERESTAGASGSKRNIKNVESAALMLEPQSCVTQSGVNYGNNANRHAAQVFQVMCSVLEPREMEIAHLQKGFHYNRYGIFSTEARGSNYGYAAEIYLALVRIVDRLRLHKWKKVPWPLRQLFKGDQFELENLRRMYLGDGDFEKITINELIQEISTVSSWTEMEAAFVSCVLRNFKFEARRIQDKTLVRVVVDKQEVTRKAVEQAFENRQHWLSHPPSERENEARRAGWTKRTAKNREEKIGGVIHSLAQTCVEGGDHV